MYTLKELKAPDGYELAADLEFRVNVDGSMEVKDGENWKACDDGMIVMYDKAKDKEEAKKSTTTTVAGSTKTGDTLRDVIGIVSVVALISGAAVFFSARRSRRSED